MNFGFWQVRRLAQARVTNEIIEARTSLPNQSLFDAVAMPQFEYVPVQVQGVYDPDHEVLLRGRSLDGRPGFHVLTPMVLSETEVGLEGMAVLVERGWVPYDMDQVPVQAALPPMGLVVVQGQVYEPNTAPTGFLSSWAAHDPAEGVLVQSFYEDVARLQPQMPYPLVNAFIKLRQQTPPTPGSLPAPLPEEVHDLGPHLGYAIQWFSFAVIGIVGYVFLLRSVSRSRDGRADAAAA